MMFDQVKVADQSDLDGVIALYKAICDHQDADQFGADWTWGEYPSPEGLAKMIKDDCLVIGKKDGQIIAGALITVGEDYPQVDWPTKVSDDKIGVIHLLGIHPDFRGQGLSKQILQAAFQAARHLNLQVLHLDTLGGNVPAYHLYTSNGFKPVETLTLHYDDIGDQKATVMEYQL